MAARENQGLQIALIFFVIVAVVMIVISFFAFAKYRERDAAYNDLNTKLNQAKQQADEAQKASRTYRVMISGAENEKDEVVQAAAAQEFEQFAKNMPESERNYRALLKSMNTLMVARDKKIAEITVNQTEMANKMKANDDAHKNELAKVAKEFEKAKTDVAEIRAHAEQTQADAERNTSDATGKAATRRQQFERDTKKLTDQVASGKTAVTGLEGQIREIKETIKKETEMRKMPDGKITGVNQGQRIVFLNRGSADGLKPQVMFSVVAQDDSNPAGAASKGKVEVIRINGPHQSDARIISDDVRNPLLPGDFIYSVVWEPGKPEHFALAGFMDLDGDGRSDRQKIKDMIALNGGIVDAEVADDGKATGKMSIDTSFLVLGGVPSTGTKDGENAGANFTKIQTDAKNIGVRVINVKDFLDAMGFKVEDRTVRFGEGANPADFKPRYPDGRQPLSPNAMNNSEPRRTPPTTQPIGY